jgi:hypothetical protein
MSQHAPFIKTKYRDKFPLLGTRPEDVDLRDICFSLSRKPRWSGFCEPWYSIGRHSLLVALEAEHMAVEAGLSKREQLIVAIQGSMHDGAEAYTEDISSPLKGMEFMSGYRTYQGGLDMVVFEAAGVFGGAHRLVRDADVKLGATEGAVLMGYKPAELMHWGPYDDTIAKQVLSPRSMREVEQELYDYVIDRQEQLARLTAT